VITLEEFQASVTSLLQLLPMQRPLTAPALVLAWDTFPASAKRDLSGEVLGFCVGQRLMDPAPPKELAPHLALLRYAYPLENDRPITDRGLRSDLRERMAFPDRFHDPAPVRHEQAAPPARPQLPGRGNGFWHPSQLTPEARRRHVQGVGAELERVLARGRDGRPWSAAHLAQGADWFRRCLQGFWPLQCDDGGLAAAWAARNESLARQLVADALSGAAPALPAADAVPVAAIVGGFASSEEDGSW